MHNDCVTVDELILEIADYKSSYQEVAVEELKRVCSQSFEAYDYLQDASMTRGCPSAHEDIFSTR